MTNVTLYAIDNSEGEHYCMTFESREAADAYNDAWERYTEGTCYCAERMEEGKAVEDAQHVITLAEVQAALSEDWLTLGTNVCELSAQHSEATFKAVEVNEVGTYKGNTMC